MESAGVQPDCGWTRLLELGRYPVRVADDMTGPRRIRRSSQSGQFVGEQEVKDSPATTQTETLDANRQQIITAGETLVDILQDIRHHFNADMNTRIEQAIDAWDALTG